MRVARDVSLLVLVLVGSLGATPSRACDPAGADAAALQASRAAIDAACPCDGPTRRAYRACAATAVAAEVTGLRLPASCRREALRYARKSRCGWPGAAVCCRLTASGRERHRVVTDAARCLPPPGGSACVSGSQSIVTGCDATGCVLPPAVCGNGIVESPETCDPPDLVTCDFSCQAIVCPPPGPCGNGVLDPGEACEPPGTATCDRTCQPAACPAAPPGETTLACLDAASGRVGVASNGSGYLAAWSGRLFGTGSDILARRLDAGGVPVDAAPVVVSDGAPCGDQHYDPTVASDGADYGVSWWVSGASGYSEEIFVREVGAGGTAAGLPLQLASHVPFGMCRDDLLGPVASAPVGAHRYATIWRDVASCYNTGKFFEIPVGRLLTLPAGTPSASIAFPGLALPPPGIYPEGPTSVASLGADVLAVTPVAYVSGPGPAYDAVSSVAGAWVDPSSGATTTLSLGSAAWWEGLGPVVAGGNASFLVAWPGRTGPDASSLTEIRGRRVARVAGPLDPDGGFRIAMTASGNTVASGPAIAFDGTVWLVAWIEKSPTAYDLRTMAVRTDGSTVSAIPLQQASGVAPVAPAVASGRTGTVVVVFERTHAGGLTGIQSLVVIPGS